MPDVHFVGEISFATCDTHAASLSWAIVPGSDGWFVRQGLHYGETHAAVVDETDSTAVLAHPLDVHLQTSSIEGWPVFIFEVWDRSHQEVKAFLGCGSAWLPCSPGKHTVEVSLWRPCTPGFSGLLETLIPRFPNVAKLRELSLSPYLRPDYECESVGVVQLNLYVACGGFEQFGVSLT